MSEASTISALAFTLGIVTPHTKVIRTATTTTVPADVKTHSFVIMAIYTRVVQAAGSPAATTAITPVKAATIRTERQRATAAVATAAMASMVK